MMTILPAQRQPRTLVPDLAELFTGSPLFAGLRAEIPGIDPAKDIDITVRGGVLTIKAVRSRKAESNGRSGFSYGASVRSVPLPSGADAEDITATYDKGILTVSVPVPEGAPVAKHIEVHTVDS